MKNSNDTTENRTRDLPAAPRRDPGWQVLTEIPEESAAIVISIPTTYSSCCNLKTEAASYS